MNQSTALIVVDMQNYYLKSDSDFYQFAVNRHPEAMDYISTRCQNQTIPNIQKLLSFFRDNNMPIIFLKLCGNHPQRQDLHRFFRKEFERGLKDGFNNVYPLASDIMADVIQEISPLSTDIIIEKTTFSAFASTKIIDILNTKGIKNLIFTGLATSQCVETTSRDASDNGFTTIHIEDAQADYSETNHRISIYGSAAVCGGWIYDTDSFILNFKEYLKVIEEEEK